MYRPDAQRSHPKPSAGLWQCMLLENVCEEHPDIPVSDASGVTHSFATQAGTTDSMKPTPTAFQLCQTAQSWCQPVGVIEKAKRGHPLAQYLVLECSLCPDKCKRDCLEVKRNPGEDWDGCAFMTRVDTAINSHKNDKQGRRSLHGSCRASSPYIKSQLCVPPKKRKLCAWSR